MRTIRLAIAVISILAIYGVIDGRLSIDFDCSWGRLWFDLEIGSRGIVVEEWGT